MLQFVASVLILSMPLMALAQAAPVIVSVTPTNGAINVATNSTIVFVFDQDMKTAFPFSPFRSQSGLSGNFDIQPTNLLNINGSWGADKRTLTITIGVSGWPYTSNIVWTLNPPTNGGLVISSPFSGTNGVAFPTVSGSFKVAAQPPPPPKIAFVTPTNNATEVPPSTALIYVFDEDMDTSVPIQTSTLSFNGNYSFSLPAAITNGYWADKRTLTFLSATPINLSMQFGWVLNPIGATIPLRNTFGAPLARTNGGFTIMTNTGGDPNEICQTNFALQSGSYFFAKRLQQQRQTGAGILVPDTNAPASFIVSTRSSSSATKIRPKAETHALTNGSLTFPDAHVATFTNAALFGGGATNFNGPLGIYDSNTTDIALEANYPPGLYTLRLDQVGDPESVIPMNPPASPPHPVIQNYSQLQQINAGQGLTLNWNPLTPGPGAFVSLTVTDSFGKLVFAAPNLCVSRTLDPAATSLVIPANTFRAGVSYLGSLQFRYNFYHSTNDAPDMAGDGFVSQTTTFELKVTGGNGAIATPPPASFTSVLFTNQHPKFGVHGIAGKNYIVRRTENLTTQNWITIGNVTLDNLGNAIFDDTEAGLQFPAFYQVLGGN